MFDQAVYDKIISKLRLEPSGCMVWTGFCGSFGYGMVYAFKRNIDAHRAIWIALHGPLDRTQFVCHKCDNPPCANPEHLFIGSLTDNNRDMARKGRYNHQKKTHCVHGHEFTPENTYHPPSRPNRRICITCDKERKKMTPEQLAARKIYDGSVRRGPKKWPKRTTSPQTGDGNG